jgi:hypothetical protein
VCLGHDPIPHLLVEFPGNRIAEQRPRVVVRETSQVQLG